MNGGRIFGGTSTERATSNTCSAAGSDPNLLTSCDQANSGIPFQTSAKLAITYPLPWYGVTVSGSYQGLAGALLGNDALPYGVFTAGTGFDIPNGRSTYVQVTPTTNWTAATCNNAAKCTTGQRIVPGLTQATLNLLLNPPQTEYAPRLNQVDFAVSKSLTLGQIKFSPKMDIFNLFNSDDYTGVSSMQYGATTYKQPSTILQARIIRIGVDVKW